MRFNFPSLIAWFQDLSPRKRTLLTIFGLCTGILLFSWVASRPQHLLEVTGNAPKTGAAAPRGQQLQGELNKQWENLENAPRAASALPQPPSGAVADWSNENSRYPAPLIEHAAEVAVTTKQFARSRANLEDIVERHHGYTAKLRMVGQPGGSTLTATLRVPSAEFNGVVTDLKTLGNVEREEQTADEITAERADLEAQLRSAQNTLARLKDALDQGWKAGNPTDLQRQLANVSAEIARLEAQRTATERRVLFSQVLFSLQEEPAPASVTFGAQLRTAASAGLSEAATDLGAITLFVVSRGPATLLWVLLLYFPSRWLWRKFQSGRNVSLEAGT